MGGVKSFLNTIFAAIHTSSYDVIIITETWLNDAVFNEELFGPDWFVYRKDRQSNFDDREGGGVLIAVNNRFVSSSIPSLANTLEQLSVKISLTSSKNICINVAYIPPDCDVDVYMNYVQHLTNVLDNLDDSDEVLVIGDFNLPEILWVNDEDDPGTFDACNISTEKEAILVDGCTDLGLGQICDIKNNFGHVLDLAFTTMTDCLTLNLASHRLKNDSVFHKALELNFCVEMIQEDDKIDEWYRDFNHADYEAINEFLSEVDWNAIFHDIEIEECVRIFDQHLCHAVEQFVPLRKRRVHCSRPWLSADLRNLRNVKNRAYKTYLSTLTDTDFSIFSDLCAEFQARNESAYASYISRSGDKLRKDPKTFWNLVNSRRKSNVLPKCMNFGDRSCTTDADKCDLFAEFFQSVYVQPTVPLIKSTVPREDLFDPQCLSFELDDIREGIMKLNPHKSAGPDDFPNRLLIGSVDSIASPLKLIFNSSLTSGIFPSSWKSSYIIPIFKSGDKGDMTNYRGIAKLSAIPKLFEKLLCEKTTPLMCDIIDGRQHGFVAGKSTDTNMISFINYLLTQIEKGHQVDAIYTDFQKAFDRVNIELLLSELKSNGLPQKFITWISSYLNGRTQAVKIGSDISSTIRAWSGVPQGSHLGPVLFVIFVNSICDIFRDCECLLYADDLKMYRIVDDTSDASTLQVNLDALSDWCDDMLMSLSIPKCKIVSFAHVRSPIVFDYKIDGQSLERCQVMRDLGILMDTAVNFDAHIDQQIARANRMLGFVKRNAKQFDDPFVTKSLFCALVRPILEYGSVGWNPFTITHKKRIESIQRRFVRFALRGLGWANPFDLPPYGQRLLLLDMNTLADRREAADFAFLLKLMDGVVSAPELSELITTNTNPYATRHRNPLAAPTHHTCYGENEPMTRMMVTLNRHKTIAMTDKTWRTKKTELLRFKKNSV